MKENENERSQQQKTAFDEDQLQAKTKKVSKLLN